MNITITNKVADIDGKKIAYASCELNIKGDSYPVRLAVDKDDKAKLNRALRNMGFVIGETTEDIKTTELAFCIHSEKGEIE